MAQSVPMHSRYSMGIFYLHRTTRLRTKCLQSMCHAVHRLFSLRHGLQERCVLSAERLIRQQRDYVLSASAKLNFAVAELGSRELDPRSASNLRIHMAALRSTRVYSQERNRDEERKRSLCTSPEIRRHALAAEEIINTNGARQLGDGTMTHSSSHHLLAAFVRLFEVPNPAVSWPCWSRKLRNNTRGRQ